MNIIYQLSLRQLKKYFRSKSRIIGSLGQPLLFFIALGFGLGPVFAKSGGGNYVDFLVPGIVAMGVLFTAMFAGIEIIWDRQFGFLKETMVAPVPRWKVMFGRTLGGALVAVIQGILIFILAFIFGFRYEHFALFPVALVVMLLMAIVFTAFGTAIASRLNDMQGFPLIMNFIMMPLFFLSGALFPLEGLPKALKIITTINPLTYAVDGLRHVVVGSGHYLFATDMGVLVAVAVLVMAIGTYLFSTIKI